MSGNDKYEYPNQVKLEGLSGRHFAIPSSIILDDSMGDKRVTAFSYFATKRGMDDEVMFTVNDMAEWSGRKPNRIKNGVNDRFMQVVERLADDGYLRISGKMSHASPAKATFCFDRVGEAIDENRQFAIIYVDELKKILEYNDFNSKDSFFNCDVILLVFAYLRMMIFRRKNEMLPSQRNVDGKNDLNYDIEVRRLKYPEAYNAHYNDIALVLDISERAVSKAVEVLDKLGLLRFENLPRVKHGDKWRTGQTVFCNAYKREGVCLLDCSDEYAKREISNKKKKIDQLFKRG